MKQQRSVNTLEPVVLQGTQFLTLNGHLLVLLRSLSEAQWQLPTLCDGWCVKDLAAHILDGMLRRLSMHRDGYRSPNTVAQYGSPDDLVGFLRRLNHGWTHAADRLSPQMLIALLEWTEPQVAAFFDSLDPHGPAIIPVSWAGENESKNWMDVARDFTEQWNHQRQIADAVGHGSEAIEQPAVYRPVLETYVRGIPMAFSHVIAPEGTRVRLVVSAEHEWQWDIVRFNSVWVVAKASGQTDHVIEIPPEAAWLVLTKRWPPEKFLERFPNIQMRGDQHLVSHVLNTVAMVA